MGLLLVVLRVALFEPIAFSEHFLSEIAIFNLGQRQSMNEKDAVINPADGEEYGEHYIYTVATIDSIILSMNKRVKQIIACKGERLKY